MSFTFLHPEFFVWMGIPVALLFTLWMTQKPFESTIFTSEALKKLRSPAVTMGLQGRNVLFFAASILLITAMAQPAVLDTQSRAIPRANVLLALDISDREVSDFDDLKKKAAGLISALNGENVGAVAYDEFSYWIVPLTQDTRNAAALVEGVSADGLHRKTADMDAMLESVRRSKKTDDRLILIPVSAKTAPKKQEIGGITVLPMEKEEAIEAVVERIQKEKERYTLIHHIPLFYYPLGLAMLLVWIALSSMSKRQSVPLAAIVIAIGFGEPSAVHAGILDFRILNAAKESYEGGEYDQSERLYERYRQMHDSPQIRYNLANTNYKAGRYEEARRWYERVYTSDPELRERTRYNLGKTLEMIERHKPAHGGEMRKTADDIERMKRGNDGSGSKPDQGENHTPLFRIW